ncbi:FliH/SctL family protein [Novosphingobium sp.]|uniref:FliH/SctL family protein n=1 Tax=Novosphingobium sp. TaxID=1874826 RepID=UPI0028ABABB7|nr:FliH/SctL family protein [Novosphingobium sp.]
MSDLGFSRRRQKPGKDGPEDGQESATRLLLGQLAVPSGFQPDARFAGETAPTPPEPPPSPSPDPAPEPSDPIAEAFSHGFTMGHDQALQEARVRAETEAAALQRLSLAFEKMDEALEEELRMRLRDTVTALCEVAIAPMAIEPDALLRRIGVAVAMLRRAEDERLIRLHPDDLRLVSPRLSAEWQVQPDNTLERGTIRIETATGGIEDGPANWRRAITEALQRC